jgi:hypothetical protein
MSKLCCAGKISSPHQSYAELKIKINLNHFRVWTANNDAKKFPTHTAQLYRSAFTLRQRMMSAIQNFEYYMMIEVIEPNWHTFFQNMERVKNIDEVLAYHQDFLDLCLKNCMLTDPDLLKSIIHLCNICIEFCEFIGVSVILAISFSSIDQHSFINTLTLECKHGFDSSLNWVVPVFFFRVSAKGLDIVKLKGYFNIHWCWQHSGFLKKKVYLTDCTIGCIKKNHFHISKSQIVSVIALLT